jgi:flagellar biosynthetic protein FliQ
MEAADVVEIGRDSLIVMLKLAGPIMIAALVIGLVISLFQALTQIQEMTLAFVPKMVIIFVVFILLTPFMIQTLVVFTQQLAGRIAGLG